MNVANKNAAAAKNLAMGKVVHSGGAKGVKIGALWVVSEIPGAWKVHGKKKILTLDAAVAAAIEAQ